MSIHIYPNTGGGGGNYDPPIPISDVAGLQASLNSKLQSPINISDVTNLQSVLDNKLEAPIAQSDVTGLTSALSGKAEKYLTLTAGENLVAGDPVMIDWVTGKARKVKRTHFMRHSNYLNGITGMVASSSFHSVTIGDGRIVYFFHGTNTTCMVFDANTNTWGTGLTVRTGTTTGKGIYWDASQQRIVVTYTASSIHYYRLLSISGTTLTATSSETQVITSTLSIDDGICGDGLGTVFFSTLVGTDSGVVAGTIDAGTETITFGSASIVSSSSIRAQICFLDFAGIKRVCACYPFSNITVRLFSYSGTTLTVVNTITNNTVSLSGTSYRIATDSNSKVIILRGHSGGGSADKITGMIAFNVTENTATNFSLYLFETIRADSHAIAYDPTTKYFVVSIASLQTCLIRNYAVDIVDGSLMISRPTGRTMLYQSTAIYPFQSLTYDPSLDIMIFGGRFFTETQAHYYIFNNAFDERLLVIGIAITNASQNGSVTVATSGVVEITGVVAGRLYNISNSGSISLIKTPYQIGIGIGTNQLLINRTSEEVMV